MTIHAEYRNLRGEHFVAWIRTYEVEYGRFNPNTDSVVDVVEMPRARFDVLVEEERWKRV